VRAAHAVDELCHAEIDDDARQRERIAALQAVLAPADAWIQEPRG
jgi:hypothetical protein